jgi:hypothetical protein
MKISFPPFMKVPTLSPYSWENINFYRQDADIEIIDRKDPENFECWWELPHTGDFLIMSYGEYGNTGIHHLLRQDAAEVLNSLLDSGKFAPMRFLIGSNIAWRWDSWDLVLFIANDGVEVYFKVDFDGMDPMPFMTFPGEKVLAKDDFAQIYETLKPMHERGGK